MNANKFLQRKSWEDKEEYSTKLTVFRITNFSYNSNPIFSQNPHAFEYCSPYTDCGYQDLFYLFLGKQGGNVEEATSNFQGKKWQFSIARSLWLPMSLSVEEKQEV